MNNRQPGLVEVLQPRFFLGHPKRAAVTRTVIQPEIDKFEQADAQRHRHSMRQASSNERRGPRG